MLILVYFYQKTQYYYLFSRNYPPILLDLPPLNRGLYCFYISKKNNLILNNLDCQTHIQII
jgi:hypothetical protein